nr:VOC family protein [Baekduia alba]
MRIDHAILAVGDLAAAAAELTERTGLAVRPQGRIRRGGPRT